jgi:hypothetical protein
MPSHIGTLAEKSLHAALKAWYARPGDMLEYPLSGYVVDIARPLPDDPDGYQCIEIQTRSLSTIKPKLRALLDSFPIRVIYPIAQERHIVRVDTDGVILSRRKSPKRGTVYHLFPEFVSLPALAAHPHFVLEVLLIREEEYWLDDGRGSWRRKHWSIHDRQLLDVVQAVPLATPADFAALLPAGLPDTFDTQELAQAIRQPRFLAQKMSYCLREMAVLEVVGKRKNALLYRITKEPS